MGQTFVYNTGSSEDDKKKDELRLEYGVFIDGTLNNKDNTDLRVKYAEKTDNGLTAEEKEERKKYLAASHRSMVDKMGTDNSFSNDYTNVARKWTCCSKDYRIYVPGMGTSDIETQGIKKDDDDGFQYGAGSKSGIRARVRLGCENLATKIYEIIKKNPQKKVTTITIDIFGFSRGAAAARNFVYEVTKVAYMPKEIEINYYENQVVPQSYTFTKTDRLIIIPEHTIRVEKKKKVLMADADGLKTDPSLYINGKLPNMGHLGYSLLKLGVSKKKLEEINVIVRFLGIYDTVSSYEEWGALGNDSTIKKGIKHLSKSLFKDDIKQLNLNTLQCAKIVHFTAKDEHRENFDLTRIQNANIRSKEGTYSRVEKNFPGVHCDIGGAYLTGKEIVDEIEVVNKPDLTGLKNPGNISQVSKHLLQEFAKKLINEYWYKEAELKIQQELGGTGFGYFKLRGEREKVYKEYSYVPLHFMKDYCMEYIRKYINEALFKRFEIKDKNLIAAKNHLKKYVMNEGGREWNFIPDEVFIRKQKIERYLSEKKERESMEKQKKSMKRYDDVIIPIDKLSVKKPIMNPQVILNLPADQVLLRELRHKYFHWSANRDWAGMDPNDNRKRVEH